MTAQTSRTLWYLEVGKHFWSLNVADACRRRPQGFTSPLAALPIVVDWNDFDACVAPNHRIASDHRLTLYDAAYLELSLRRGLPLATFDAALRRAANAANVALL